MAIPVFPQTREGDLLQWSADFSGQIKASPTSYGLVAAQATAFEALQLDFADKYAIATNPATNSKMNVEEKNIAKNAMLNGPGGAKQLVEIIQAFPGMTDAMRVKLNIRVRDVSPTPVPVPTQSPDVDIVSTFSNTITVRVHDSEDEKRRRPVGVKGATVLWAIGENPPADDDAWTFSGNTTKNIYEITLPIATPAGSRVWVTAFWFNNRMESGPAASPVSTNVPGKLAAAA